MSPAVQARCQATTQAGTRCRRAARDGRPYCTQHAATTPATAVADQRHALRQQLAAEVDGAVTRLRQGAPDFEPPPLDAAAVMTLLRTNLTSLTEPLGLLRETVADSSPRDWLDPATWRGLAYVAEHSFRFQIESWQAQLSGRIPPEWGERLRQFWREDAFDRATWEGVWYLLNYTARLQVEQLQRRRAGEYETDPWGRDEDVVAALQPLFAFLYSVYWRVEASGLAHVPAAGRGLLVIGEGRRFQLEAAMVATAVAEAYPAGRPVRSLFSARLPTLPFLAPLLTALGQTLATVENAAGLLAADQLVAVSLNGHGRTERRIGSRLTRSGLANFVTAALRSGAPIIPVAIGSTVESLFSPSAAQRLTWLTPLPMPTKWTIKFGRPLPFDSYAPADADDPLFIARVAAGVRDEMRRLVGRRRP